MERKPPRLSELDREMGMFTTVLQKRFEKINRLSSTLPESGANEINFALFKMNKKKKAGTTKTTVTTKIGV